MTMSGSSILGPRPSQAVAKSFHSLSEALGAVDLDQSRKLKVLLETPSEEFATRTNGKGVLGPVVDGSIIPGTTTYATLREEQDLKHLYPGSHCCKRFLIGDCEFDVSPILCAWFEHVLTTSYRLLPGRYASRIATMCSHRL